MACSITPTTSTSTLLLQSVPRPIPPVYYKNRAVHTLSISEFLNYQLFTLYTVPITQIMPCLFHLRHLPAIHIPTISTLYYYLYRFHLHSCPAPPYTQHHFYPIYYCFYLPGFSYMPSSSVVDNIAALLPPYLAPFLPYTVPTTHIILFITSLPYFQSPRLITWPMPLVSYPLFCHAQLSFTTTLYYAL